MVYHKESIQKVSSKLDNGKVFKSGGKGGEFKGDEEFEKNKMQKSQMPSQNESMHELFKSSGDIEDRLTD